MDEWDRRFSKEGEIWGKEPSVCAIMAADCFSKNGAKTVLDMACGYGRDSTYLAKNFSVTGVDSSAEGIWMANERALRESVLARFLLADVRMLPFPDASFDAILCNNILTLFLRKEREMVVREVERVLKRGGALAVSNLSTSSRPRAKDGERELEENTYTEKGHEHFHHYFTREELASSFPQIKFEQAEEKKEAICGRPRLNWLMQGIRI